MVSVMVIMMMIFGYAHEKAENVAKENKELRKFSKLLIGLLHGQSCYLPKKGINSDLKKKLCVSFWKWKIEALGGNVQQKSRTTEIRTVFGKSMMCE